MARYPKAALCQEPTERDRRASGARPELQDGPHDAFGIGVKNAIVPIPISFREVGVVSDHIQRRLKNAVPPWLGILCHEEDVADTVAANLVNKLVKARRMRQVRICIGLNAMTVATADHKVVPLFRYRLSLTVLLPVCASRPTPARG